jgi:hypothetical protein
MPCGGIFPDDSLSTSTHPCWQCNKPGCDLFCIEWDAPIHSACVKEFLEGPEGEIVLNHGHEVSYFNDKGVLEILHEEVPEVLDAQPQT